MNTRNIINLASRYYEVKDKVSKLEEELLDLRKELRKEEPGRYGNYIITYVKTKLIRVKPYTRNGYKTIRRSR